MFDLVRFNGLAFFPVGLWVLDIHVLSLLWLLLFDKLEPEFLIVAIDELNEKLQIAFLGKGVHLVETRLIKQRPVKASNANIT